MRDPFIWEVVKWVLVMNSILMLLWSSISRNIKALILSAVIAALAVTSLIIRRRFRA